VLRDGAECFDDPDIAALMNELFVSIVIEERPMSTTSGEGGSS
jgi:hypothetical protein